VFRFTFRLSLNGDQSPPSLGKVTRKNQRRKNAEKDGLSVAGSMVRQKKRRRGDGQEFWGAPKSDRERWRGASKRTESRGRAPVTF